MPPPNKYLGASDCLFRDIVSRNQYHAAATGNSFYSSYHHVHGNASNVSVIQVVGVDNKKDAEMDVLLRTSSSPLSLASVAAGNMGSNSILSVRRGVTEIRSATTEIVGNLMTFQITGNPVNVSIAPGGLLSLGNCLIRSFQKTLGPSVGNTSAICSLQNDDGGYVVELDVFQSNLGASVAKKYQFVVGNNATPNAPYHRLVPLASSQSQSASDWGVEVRTERITLKVITYLRLVRLSSGVSANLECTVTVYQSRFDSVSLDAHEFTGNVTFSNTLHESTQVTQARGLVGIGTDTPHTTLTVSGNVSAESLTADTVLAGTCVGALGAIFNNTAISQGSYMSFDPYNDGVDFICKRGLGVGGFHFIQSNGHGTSLNDGKVVLGRIDSQGITLPQGAVFSAPGSILGSVFATGTPAGMTEGIAISPQILTSSPSWITVATYTYAPKSASSQLSLYVDITYLLGGGLLDIFKSRLTVNNVEVSFKQQRFNTSSGSGTRSNVIFPISALVKNTSTASKTIRVQLLLNEADDQLHLSPNNWVFRLLERKT